jgi:hypothetical protein
MERLHLAPRGKRTGRCGQPVGFIPEHTEMREHELAEVLPTGWGRPEEGC